jgi:hypothetical protein
MSIALPLIIVCGFFSTAPEPPALGGRPLSWDSFGVFQFAATQKLTDSDNQLLADIQSANLAKADSLARFMLRSKDRDFLPAWTLVQVARARKSQKLLAMSVMSDDFPCGNPQVLAYLRFYAEGQYYDTITDSAEDEAAKSEVKRLRSECASRCADNLPVVIAVLQQRATPISEARSVVETYRRAHPSQKGVGVLVCRSMLLLALHGKHIRECLSAGRFLYFGEWDDEVQPYKILETTDQMLTQKDNIGLAHYYRARAFFALRKDSQAFAEAKIALKDPDIPDRMRSTIPIFLTSKSDHVFYRGPILE